LTALAVAEDKSASSTRPRKLIAGIGRAKHPAGTANAQLRIFHRHLRANRPSSTESVREIGNNGLIASSTFEVAAMMIDSSANDFRNGRIRCPQEVTMDQSGSSPIKAHLGPNTRRPVTGTPALRGHPLSMLPCPRNIEEPRLGDNASPATLQSALDTLVDADIPTSTLQQEGGD